MVNGAGITPSLLFSTRETEKVSWIAEMAVIMVAAVSERKFVSNGRPQIGQLSGDVHRCFFEPNPNRPILNRLRFSISVSRRRSAKATGLNTPG